jgi:hypothetical protein
VQAEIEDHVPFYADQVKQHGHIKRWAPRRGRGRSARAMRAAPPGSGRRRERAGPWRGLLNVLPKREQLPS